MRSKRGFVRVVCDFCSKEFDRPIGKFNQAKRDNTKLTFCGKSCQIDHQAKKFHDSIRERFFERVDKDPEYKGPWGDCWGWKGKTNKGDYGIFHLFGHSRIATWTSYYLEHGYIPDFKGKGELIGHHCDNPPCTNPKHLFLTDTAGNAADRDAKGRQVKGEDIPNAKLNTLLVSFIRSFYTHEGFSKQETYSFLSRMLNIGGTAIRDIINGRSWKHVPPVVDIKDYPVKELKDCSTGHIIIVKDLESAPICISANFKFSDKPIPVEDGWIPFRLVNGQPVFDHIVILSQSEKHS